MKILHTVEFYSPSVGGAQEVIRQISERLVEKGHDVTVATSTLRFRKQHSIKGVKIKEFDISGNAVKGYRGNINDYYDFLINNQFDIILNYAAQQWTTDLFFDVFDNIKGVKIFAPCGFSNLYNPAYTDYYKHLPDIMRKYDHLIYHSQTYQDFAFSKKNSICNLSIIHNGADEREFKSESTVSVHKLFNLSENQQIILHVGSFTGTKGQKEAIDIFNAANINNVVLLLIGNPVDKRFFRQIKLYSLFSNVLPKNWLNHKRIIVADFDRQKTISAYNQASLFLFPSYIECSPLVLTECLAAGIPFLSSRTGNSTEIVKTTKAGFIMPTKVRQRNRCIIDTEKSALMVSKLLSNQNKLKLMGKSGYNYWKNHLSWDLITKQYEDLYVSLFNKKIGNQTDIQ